MPDFFDIKHAYSDRFFVQEATGRLLFEQGGGGRAVAQAFDKITAKEICRELNKLRDAAMGNKRDA